MRPCRRFTAQDPTITTTQTRGGLPAYIASRANAAVLTQLTPDASSSDQRAYFSAHARRNPSSVQYTEGSCCQWAHFAGVIERGFRHCCASSLALSCSVNWPQTLPGSSNLVPLFAYAEDLAVIVPESFDSRSSLCNLHYHPSSVARPLHGLQDVPFQQAINRARFLEFSDAIGSYGPTLQTDPSFRTCATHTKFTL